MLFSLSGTVSSDGYIEQVTSFKPVVGTTYRVTIETDIDTQYKGELSITATNNGNMPSIVAPEGDWMVQFNRNADIATFSSPWAFGGETVNLTVYG